MCRYDFDSTKVPQHVFMNAQSGKGMFRVSNLLNFFFFSVLFSFSRDETASLWPIQETPTENSRYSPPRLNVDECIRTVLHILKV